MWRRVDIVLADVLEERISSFFRVEEKIRERGTSVSRCWSVSTPERVKKVKLSL
jgi:hypothetical protein